MRRRDFVTLLSGAAAGWPLAGHAQQQALPVIGYLFSGVREAAYEAGFLKGLSETGYVASRDVTIEYRSADNQNDRLPGLAADLVRRKVALIIASPGNAALAAKAATTTIPIDFQIGIDPVKLGLVASFNRPGGNLTGVSQLSTTLAAKRLGILHELIPNASKIAVLADPESPNYAEQTATIQDAARSLGLSALILNGRNMDSLFANLAGQQTDALFVAASAYFASVRDQITLLAARHQVPVIYESRDYTVAGGLMSYGVDFVDIYRQLGNYAGKILKGAKPADLPVMLPTKFELVINLKTAKVLGLTVPPTLLATADDVIE